MRPGDNKWSTSIFARDAKTGEALWAYQTTPHDEHDYDGVNELLLLDLDVSGQTRTVAVRPGRNGFMYVIDRATGEVLSGRAVRPRELGLARGSEDRACRRSIEDKTTGNRAATNVCPAAPGHEGLAAVGVLARAPGCSTCRTTTSAWITRADRRRYIAGTPYVGAQVKMYAGPGGHRGVFTAWDPAAQRKVWEIKERFPVWSGARGHRGRRRVLRNDGPVVQGGGRAQRASRCGSSRWAPASSASRSPTSGPTARQYVAILSGVGGWAGAAALGILPDVDPYIALGFANAMKDLPDYTAQGGMLYVFALAGRAGGRRGSGAGERTPEGRR